MPAARSKERRIHHRGGEVANGDSDKGPKGAYLEILVQLRDTIRIKINQLFKLKQWKLLHDNAPAHRAIIVED
ncbi:hypothetical protein LAZ67_5001361 [Cordylochernes scorpioides]|uniref:Transposase n=1 Tax=Cordylochernes scorpioides TaxID=51811 RepID=A0ABY6KFS6_9ARAC|nr:hypothetical protein LAZ67_5001361 [Cordylochernes scorpioides]